MAEAALERSTPRPSRPEMLETPETFCEEERDIEVHDLVGVVAVDALDMHGLWSLGGACVPLRFHLHPCQKE